MIKYLRDEECKGKGILQPEKMNCVISPSTLGERGRAGPLRTLANSGTLCMKTVAN